MARPQFSEMLISRRRELGLSIKQASQVLKLKEQVLIAFEEGDYTSIPKSGYAQGMLSSYARYLGLNAREVVDLFLQESFEFTNGTTSHELRRRARDTRHGRDIEGYEIVNEADSRPRAYVPQKGLLPTSGGLAGDMGAFATTSGAQHRSATTGSMPASVPLVNSRANSYTGYSHAEYVHGHAYNDPAAIERASSRRSVRRREMDLYTPTAENDDARDAYDSSTATQIAGRRREITTQQLEPSQYTDDLRYDDEASSYESSASQNARRSLHNSMRSVDRPNVRRRSGANARKRRNTNNGLVGKVADFFSNSANVLAIIVVALGIALTVVIIGSVSSCVASRNASERPVSTTEGSGAQSENTGVQGTRVPVVKPQEESTEASDASAASVQTVPEAPTYTVVKVEVSIAEGELSWIQVDMDGETLIAETVTGPWNETYLPKQQFSIQVGNTLATTVKKDGELVAYDYKTSGVGSITIEGSGEPLTEASAGTPEAGEGGAVESTSVDFEQPETAEEESQASTAG